MEWKFSVWGSCGALASRRCSGWLGARKTLTPTLSHRAREQEAERRDVGHEGAGDFAGGAAEGAAAVDSFPDYVVRRGSAGAGNGCTVSNAISAGIADSASNAGRDDEVGDTLAAALGVVR